MTLRDLKRDFDARLCHLATGQLGLRLTLAQTVTVPVRDKGQGAGGEGAELAPTSPTSNPRQPPQPPAPSPETLSILDMVASDATLDRYNEVIDPRGWQLDNYRRNPVVQNSHQYGDIVHTIGKALFTEIRDGRLVQRWQFAVNENPVAKLAYDLYRGGYLNASSVGFIPIDWRAGKPGDDFERIFLKQELLENSAVSIPANPNALANAYQAGAVEKSTLRELADMLRFTPSEAGRSALKGDTAEPPPASPRTSPQNPQPSVRQLADALKQVSKGL